MILFQTGAIIHMLRCGFILLWILAIRIANQVEHTLIDFLLFAAGIVLERIGRHYVIFKAKEQNFDYAEDLSKWFLRRVYFDMKKLPAGIKPYLNEYYSIVVCFVILVVILFFISI